MEISDTDTASQDMLTPSPDLLTPSSDLLTPSSGFLTPSSGFLTLPPSPPEPKGRKTRNARRTLTLKERMTVLSRFESGESARKIARSLGCGKTQIQAIVNLKSLYKKIWDDAGEQDIDLKRLNRRNSKYGPLNARVYCWYLDSLKQGRRVTGKKIVDQALQFAAEMGQTDFPGSNGWLSSWLRRHKVSLSKREIPPVMADDSDESIAETPEMAFERAFRTAHYEESLLSEAAEAKAGPTPTGMIQVHRSIKGECSYERVKTDVEDDDSETDPSDIITIAPQSTADGSPGSQSGDISIPADSTTPSLLSDTSSPHPGLLLGTATSNLLSLLDGPASLNFSAADIKEEPGTSEPISFSTAQTHIEELRTLGIALNDSQMLHTILQLQRQLDTHRHRRELYMRLADA